MAEFIVPLLIFTLGLYAAEWAFSEGDAFSNLQCEFGTTVEGVCVGETDSIDLGDLPDIVVAFFIDLFQLLTFGDIDLHVLARVGFSVFLACGWLYAWLK